MERETAELTWGSVEAQDRRVQFSRDFGCTAWTQEAIDEIKQHSPLIEIGAGNGQWAAALARAGADIVAYDDFSALPLPHRPGERTAILRGNESVLSDWQLLLRYKVSLSLISLLSWTDSFFVCFVSLHQAQDAAGGLPRG